MQPGRARGSGLCDHGGIARLPGLVRISGQFMDGVRGEDVTSFLRIAEDQRYGAVVYLDSKGGFITAAVEIGRAIRKHGFSTVVADNATCNSACALIWLAGKERYIGPKVQLGFHASKDIRDGTVSATGTAITGAYLYEMGITDILTIARLVNSPPSGMTWLGVVELARWKIDAKVLRGDLAMRTTRSDQDIGMVVKTWKWHPTVDARGWAFDPNRK
jgi:hypothetical protein